MTESLQHSTVDLEVFTAALGEIAWSTERNIVRQKSRDFFWYSPILKAQLDGCFGEIIVTPRSEGEVVVVTRLCAAHHLPVTVRGAGTGNYGQAVPLSGGVVLDMSEMTSVGNVIDGIVNAEPGAKLKDIEAKTLPQGWELRLYPSTRRTATIGGFVAGGSTGVGAINHGLLVDGGIAGLRVVTVEAEPRILDLSGPDVNRVHHAYGTTGIITQVRMPLEPSQDWVDVAVEFADFMELSRFCQAVGEDPAIAKKLVTAVAWPIPRYFRTLDAAFTEGAAVGLFMIASASLPAFDHRLAEHGGHPIYRATQAEAATRGQAPIYEYTWNHTTLQALKVDRTVTYLQTLFPAPDHLDGIAAMIEMFGDELPMHLEFVTLDGRVCCFALQIVRYTTAERLAEIIRIHEERGYTIFNPHTYVLEDGGMKQTDPEQLAFKKVADPMGLLNPGKMRGWNAIKPAAR
ncbi:MAG: FAD-linked oxidase [Rhodospirillales bacterium]|nr:FAD-linked oxidase [Rhodospirillales bacterium]